jgi:hypothetical protein
VVLGSMRECQVPVLPFWGGVGRGFRGRGVVGGVANHLIIISSRAQVLGSVFCRGAEIHAIGGVLPGAGSGLIWGFGLGP